MRIIWQFLTSNGTWYVEWFDGVHTKLKRMTQEQYDAMFSIDEDDSLDFLN